MPLHIQDFSPLVGADGDVTTINHIMGAIRYGSSWYSEIQAQRKVTARLKKFLTDRYTLFRNFTLPDVDIPIPIILVGPPGISVLNVSEVSGIFEVRGKEWLEMDEKTRKFVQAQPNLVMRTVLFSRAVEDFLQSNGIPPSTLEETLILTNPGVDITTNDPAARIVLIDALNRFVQNIKNSPPLLGNFQIAEIVALFEQTHKQMETAASESRQSPFDFLTNIKLSTAQWIILGLVLAFNAIAVLIFIAFMITNN